EPQRVRRRVRSIPSARETFPRRLPIHLFCGGATGSRVKLPECRSEKLPTISQPPRPDAGRGRSSAEIPSVHTRNGEAPHHSPEEIAASPSRKPTWAGDCGQRERESCPRFAAAPAPSSFGRREEPFPPAPWPRPAEGGPGAPSKHNP